MITMSKDSTAAMVRVETLMQGTIDVPENQIITFTMPMLGFAHLRRFCIHQTKPGFLYWLQSLEDRTISFCLLAPFSAGLDPDMEITAADVSDIAANGTADIEVYTVVVLAEDQDQIRTNLRAPILVSRTSGKAKQVVLHNTQLPIKFFLRDLQPRGEAK